VSQPAVNDFLLVLCSFSDITEAKSCATELVKQNLAGCVNLITGVTSIYQWEGELREDSECLLVIKTTHVNYENVESFLKTNHSYEVPEIIAVPIIKGSADYLNWLNDSLAKLC
jgi:periplasmic divalent cation tolerance protein